MTHLETRIGDPLLEQCISHLRTSNDWNCGQELKNSYY